MNIPDNEEDSSNLRSLPSIEQLMCTATADKLVTILGRPQTVEIARRAVASIRKELIDEPDRYRGRSSEDFIDEAGVRMENALAREQMTSLGPVINATGVVIHTNLGRAPLSENARKAIAERASGYCTIEYDLEKGTRGKRGVRAESLICELTGAEAAVVVNNCAAAAFLVLKAFGSGGDVVISRGELVEIGGDFRIPDVLQQSGAKLCEVGTTNRTKLADYQTAIGENTRMILRVHPSNYRIVGFTSSPSTGELAQLAHSNGLVFFEDLGSGSLTCREGAVFADEPSIDRSIQAGADLVAFSGDKLLGGPQAGIIAGRAEYIEKLRSNPLYRILRPDKLTYAALEATLEAYRRNTEEEEIPVVRMLSATKDEIEGRVNRFIESLNRSAGPDWALTIKAEDGSSAVGGGAAPTALLETKLIALQHDRFSAEEIGHLLSTAETPVIARIVDGLVMIDLRTVSESEEEGLRSSIVRMESTRPVTINHSSMRNPA
jgi:L-seryl-tRNA(Ser) seleniumtransferase